MLFNDMFLDQFEDILAYVIVILSHSCSPMMFSGPVCN